MAHLPHLSHDVLSGSDIPPCNRINTDLRNRSSLAVNCCMIIHCLEVSCKEDQITSAQRAAQVIYLRTTDPQTVNYYSTIHALEMILFDSNTK